MRGDLAAGLFLLAASVSEKSFTGKSTDDRQFLEKPF